MEGISVDIVTSLLLIQLTAPGILALEEAYSEFYDLRALLGS
jgi:hypothetical protein